MITIDADPWGVVPTVIFNRLDTETGEVASHHAIVFKNMKTANIRAEEIRGLEHLELVDVVLARVS